MNLDVVADEEIVQYLEKNKSIHSIEKLKRGLVEQGVEEEEIDGAIEIMEEREKERREYLDKDITPKALLPKSSGSGKYVSYLDPIFNILKIHGKNKAIYYDILVYGSMSFLFMTIIIMVFENIAAKMVYSKVVEEAGIFSSLALPDVFLLDIGLFGLFGSIFWGMVIGGVVVFLFFKYFLNIWPFNIWHKLIQKVFALFLIINIFFGLFINGFLSSLNPDLFMGYLVIIVGMVFGSYAATYFLVSNLVRKYDKDLRDIIRKSI